MSGSEKRGAVAGDGYGGIGFGRMLAAAFLAVAGVAYGYLSVFFAAALGGALGAGHGDPSLGAVPALPFAGRQGIASVEELHAAQAAAGALWGVVALTLAAPRGRAAAALHVGLAGVHYWGVAHFLPTPFSDEMGVLALLLLGPYAMAQLLLSPLLVFRVALLSRLAWPKMAAAYDVLARALARVARAAPAPSARAGRRLLAGGRSVARRSRALAVSLGPWRTTLAALILACLLVLGVARYQVVLLGLLLVPPDLPDVARLFLGFVWPLWGGGHLLLSGIDWRRSRGIEAERPPAVPLRLVWDAAFLLSWVAALAVLAVPQ